MITISVFSQKGGVGKTSTATSLASGLALFGNRTLLVDMDAQCDSTALFNCDTETSIYDVLRKQTHIQNVIIDINDNLSVISANPMLSVENIWKGTGIENADNRKQLRNDLKLISEQFDYCVIDCPPNLGICTIMSLTASDYVIIPAQPETFSVHAFEQIKGTMSSIKRDLNPGLKLLGILPTFYDSRPALTQFCMNDLKKIATDLNTIVLPKIRRTSSIPTSQRLRTDIYERKGTVGREDYRDLTISVINKTKGTNRHGK